MLSTSAEGDTTGVTLKDVKEVSNPGAPLRETFFIAATNIQEWSSGPADAKIPNGTDSAYRSLLHLPIRRGFLCFRPPGKVVARRGVALPFSPSPVRDRQSDRPA